VIPKKKKSTSKRPATLHCSVVENPSKETGFVDVSKLINPTSFSQYRGFASDKIDQVEFSEFQNHLNARAKQSLNIKI